METAQSSPFKAPFSVAKCEANSNLDDKPLVKSRNIMAAATAEAGNNFVSFKNFTASNINFFFKFTIHRLM